MNKKEKRGFILWDSLGGWLIAIAALLLLLAFYFLIKGKGEGIIDFFKNLWRFR